MFETDSEHRCLPEGAQAWGCRWGQGWGQGWLEEHPQARFLQHPWPTMKTHGSQN